MLTLHHLNDSRSQRILWLLEELGTPYEMKRYQRNAETRLAPPELERDPSARQVARHHRRRHDDRRIRRHRRLHHPPLRPRKSKPAMMPAPGSADYEAYNEWLHYSEGSAMLPLMLNLYVSRLKEAGAPLHPRIDSELANHLGYVDGALKGREFFVGASLTGADIQMSFVGEMAKVFGKLEPYPNLAAWLGTDARPAGVPAERSKRAGRTGLRELSVVPAKRSASRNPERERARSSRRRVGKGHLGRRLRRPMSFRGYGPRLKAGATAGEGNWAAPFIPTISGINISPVPQVLGQFRPMWYLAGTSFDRHTRAARFAPKGLRRWRYFAQ